VEKKRHFTLCKGGGAGERGIPKMGKEKVNGRGENPMTVEGGNGRQMKERRDIRKREQKKRYLIGEEERRTFERGGKKRIEKEKNNGKRGKDGRLHDNLRPRRGKENKGKTIRVKM